MKPLEFYNKYFLNPEPLSCLPSRENYVDASQSYVLASHINQTPYTSYTPFRIACEKSLDSLDFSKKTSKELDDVRIRKIELFEEAPGLIKSKFDNADFAKIELFKSTRTYFMQDYPFIGTTIPGIVILNKSRELGLSIHLSSNQDDWKDYKIPLYCWHQVQHHMMVTNMQQCIVMADVCSEVIVRLVSADFDYQEQILAKLINFWLSVEIGDSPNPCNPSTSDNPAVLSPFPYVPKMAIIEEYYEQKFINVSNFFNFKKIRISLLE